MLKVNPNFTEINVENSLNVPNSIYHYYKKLIQLRKENLPLVYGSFELILAEHEQIFSYSRVLENETWLIIANLFSTETDYQLPEELEGKSVALVFSNYEIDSKGNRSSGTLKPYEVRVYRLT